ncbi:unnamed protein product [Phaeothamnion confervicola]
MAEPKINITFDEAGAIRVLDPAVFKHSEEVEEACRGFSSKMRDFGAAVKSVVTVVGAHAKRIERAKLQAIGERMKARFREAERRVRQKVALQALVKERMADLDRLGVQYQSLLRVEAEQLALIEKLGNSEAHVDGDHK